jgi:DNA polymerase III gamma/tau subunit
MSFDTRLLGQDESIAILNQTIKDPPHLFITGGYGSGKTTLINDFLKGYYAPYGISPADSEWTLWLSSEQDRGIHCVRQSVAEFVRHASAKPGVYRWIIIDDADSLPMISQQALRRPMETHAHTTRFLFASRHSSDLIQPLRSRCLHLELETISPLLLVNHVTRSLGYKNLNFEPSAIAIFLSIAQTPTEVIQVTKLLASIYGSKEGGYTIQSSDILNLFASPSFSLCLDLLRAYVRGKREECMRIFLEIWTTGISYEDFLHELTISIHQLGILPAMTSQRIHQVILKGWMQFAQGKTHTLDLMRLFFD